ncbi:MAG: alpha/beta hydrolase [Candidatus Protistobacter heckmanni]|nr:alpha/beta hydrolase [Candidatus Protistobacter heckmanni]
MAGISAPTTLIVGANDGPLPGAMEEIRCPIAGARLDVIPDASHLPNIDQPTAFNAALLANFLRAGR